MTKKQKKVLYRILISAALLVALALLPLDRLPYSALLRFIFYMIPYLVIGYDVLKKAVKGILKRQVFDENFLMAVATVGAVLLGDYKEGVAVMLFYQIGELFQSYAVGKSRKNISELMDIRPDYAMLEVGGSLEQVDPDEVPVGSVIVVKPGEKIPIDGIIIEGSASLNTSALTGESLPREVAAGDEVISGCINMSGLLRIQTPRGFGESTVSKILELVENSSSKKAKAENLTNIKFLDCAAEYLPSYLPAHSIGLIFLNFSCPYPKKSHACHRLTADRFLGIYKELMTDDAAIFQKTDNMHFFEFSLESFSKNGFELSNISLDLHNSDFEGNIVTEYEARFSSQGFPIYRVEARLKKDN